nr:uncharacterized protein CFP56_10828 [Quercus suber]
MECPRALSREEQEELLRSKKKVKDVSYARFQEGLDSAASSSRNDGNGWSRTTSFKEKLVGEIPGTFTQAFSFGNLMEDDADSDEEVEGLRAGLVAVKFSKELKQKIRSPWYKALIVKVYGRSVGLSFLQNRLLSMWRPAGRLDCVDLSHGFFLTRFSLREDYEAILKKGPWFIGDHFLSIRPWELDFSPATTNVVSVAVWIRLNELPIEYYHVEALLQIGKAIGNVLRVDTHTASESRGRFAQICIQVDVEKLLVTAILIGKREQPVCYEGIHKLCFKCGRIRHRKDLCLYAICQPPTLCKEANQPDGVTEVQTCSLHELVNAKQNMGPSLSVHGSVQEDVPESTYGPWIMRAIDGLQVAKAVQRLAREGLKPDNDGNEAGPSVLHVEKILSRPGKEKKSLKPNDRGRPAEAAFKPNTFNPLASVKGKKGVARNRATLSIRASPDKGESIVGSSLPLNAQGKSGSGNDQGTRISNHGQSQQESEGNLEAHPLSYGEECDGGQLISPRAGMGDSEESLVGFHGETVEGGRDVKSGLGFGASNNTIEVPSRVADVAVRGEAADRDSDLDRMELEGGVEGTPACC